MLAPSQSYIIQTWRRIWTTLRRPCTRFATLWRESHHEARKDLSPNWRRDVTCLLALVWLACLCACSGVLNSDLIDLSPSTRGACLPDGSFRPELVKSFSYWNTGFFEISVGFGKLGFTQAKAIDIIWDVVFGRGGQALIAFISWRVFAMYMTTSIEVTPVTYNTYRTVFLQTEPSLVGIPRIIRDFTLRLRLHSATAMVFIIATMIYTLAFPTLGSAMTGYSGNVKPFVSDHDSNYIAFESFNYATYVIRDGSRINQTTDYAVDAYATPYMAAMISNYVGTYGFYGRKQTSSVFMNVNLESPVLSITAFYLGSGLNGSDWTDPTTGEIPFADESRITWIYANRLYSLDDMKANGTCQATSEYKWGLSFVQVNVMIIILMMWTIGIFTMWIRSHNIMRGRGKEEVAGEHKAIFELAETMRKQLVSFGTDDVRDPLSLKESDLRCRITKDLHGGSISYDNPQLPFGSMENDDLNGWRAKLKVKSGKWWAWLKKEKWWLTASLVSFYSCFAVGFFGWSALYKFAASVPFAFGFTIYYGSTSKSRGVLLLWSFLLLLVPFSPLGRLGNIYTAKAE